MTDAYATLREMLANVPDDAQVYVEELESIVEWPGITAGTFRALLAEIAGFEAMWEQREKAHDAALAEVTKERDTLAKTAAENFKFATNAHKQRDALRAQLAEVTKERDVRRDQLDAAGQHVTILRAQLAALAQPEGTDK